MRLLWRIIHLLALVTGSLTAAERQSQSNLDSRRMVESVETSGVPESKLTPQLREDLQRLVGTTFDQKIANDLATRIQIELRDHIAATTLARGSKPDHVRVVFLVGKIGGEEDPNTNINSRYTVEDVQLSGTSESKISQELREDLRKLVGEKFDQKATDNLKSQIQRELQSQYEVSTRVIRGSKPEHVVIVFEVRKRWWKNFDADISELVYHSKHGFSAELNLPINIHTSRFTFGLVTNADQLLERYAGYRLRYENKKIGTDRLHLRVDFDTYHQKWHSATILALDQSPETPGIYRSRQNFEPTLTFIPNRSLKLTAGINVSHFQTQFPTPHGETSTAGIASIHYRRDLRDPADNTHRLDLSYGVRAATRKLDSEFVYTRHSWEAGYTFTAGRNTLALGLVAGLISGRAPLFERFSLGNASTLRGWNKFDLAPLGGNRVFHSSLEYRYSIFQIFYDTGAVWDRGQAIKARHSVGFGLREKDGFFVLLGFPVRVTRVEPIFMMGLRF